MHLSWDFSSRFLRLVFTMMMALAWCDGPQARAQQNPPPRPVAPVTNNSPQEAQQISSALVELAKLYTKVDQNLPRDTFDPQAVIQKVGNDPIKLFEWVRHQTSYVPYRGSLRGPVGVLMDRNGNSLDRALLLARLLSTVGQQVRLAHGTIAADKAPALLKSVWEDAKPMEAAPPPAAPDDAAIAKAAAAYGVDPAQLRKSVEQLQQASEKTMENVVGTVAEQSDALANMLGAPANPGASQHDSQLAAISDHWWVQRSENGTWTDLDPLTRDAKPGQRFAEPTNTSDLPANWDGLPPDKSQLHEVDVRVMTERTDGDKATSEVVLHQALQPAALVENSVKLKMIPIDWPGDLDLAAPNANELVKSTLLAQVRWVPMLQVGTSQTVQSGFDTHGVIDPKPSLDSMGKAGKSVASGAQAAADIFGNKPPEAKAPTGELTALWIEFETRIPGEKPRIVRRDIYDAFGPAARAVGGKLTEPKLDDAAKIARSAAICQQTSLLLSGSVPSGPFLSHMAMANFLGNAGMLVKVMTESSGKKVSQSLSDLAGVQRNPVAIWKLAGGRRAVPALASGVAIDRPNIFALHEGLRIDPTGTPILRQSIDIVSNDTAARGADSFKARLTQGVLDTALEHEALNRPTTGVNTVTLFAASVAQHIPWLKLASADDPNLAKLKLGNDVMARIRNDLKAGYAVVAPTSPVLSGGQQREGWWRIDSLGNCIGYDARGMGNEMAEYIILAISIVVESCFAIACIHGGGYAVGCIVCGVASVVADYFIIITGGAELIPAIAAAGGGFGFSRICEHFLAEG